MITEETRKKMSEAKKGKIPKFIPTFSGLKHTKKTKSKMIKSSKGVKKTQEHIKNMSGENHWNWKGGLTPLNKQIRKSFENRQWIQDVMKRDNYTCQSCGITNCKLEVHHIKSFALILLENKITTLEDALVCYQLFNNDNGITFCLKCHEKTDSYKKPLLKIYKKC
jgi:hypothetical protein